MTSQPGDLHDDLTAMRDELDGVLAMLGWDLETLQKESRKVVCPHDANHIIPQTSVDKHEHICPLLKLGLTRKEAASIHDSSFCYRHDVSVLTLKLSEPEKLSILASRGLPVDSSGDDPLLSPGGRLALYLDMVERVKRERKHEKMGEEDLLFLEEKNKEEIEKTDFDMRKEVRDMKRRRQSYRAKNVHITKKTYTEVMREVIGNQMELLEKRIRDQWPSSQLSSDFVKPSSHCDSRPSDCDPPSSHCDPRPSHCDPRPSHCDPLTDKIESKTDLLPESDKNQFRLDRKSDKSQCGNDHVTVSSDRDHHRNRSKSSRSDSRRRSRSRDRRKRRRSRSRDKSSERRHRHKHKSKKSRVKSRDREQIPIKNS